MAELQIDEVHAMQFRDINPTDYDTLSAFVDVEKAHSKFSDADFELLVTRVCHIDEQSDCIICGGPMADTIVVSLPCNCMENHGHSACIKQHLGNKATCPYCRKPAHPCEFAEQRRKSSSAEPEAPEPDSEAEEKSEIAAPALPAEIEAVHANDKDSIPTSCS
jgi:hypothetical protein